MKHASLRARLLVGAAAVAAALAAASTAWAHAEISPPVTLSKHLQLFTLAVPTEKQSAVTTKVQLTLPSGFGIDSFVPSPGWRRQVQQSGSGGAAVVQSVTWSGGRTPTGEDSVFQFLATPSSSNSYTFKVQQSYSDGSIVDWTGPESSDTPAPVVEAKSSLGGGGTSTLDYVALGLGAAALVISLVALLSRGGRQLT